MPANVRSEAPDEHSRHQETHHTGTHINNLPPDFQNILMDIAQNPLPEKVSTKPNNKADTLFAKRCVTYNETERDMFKKQRENQITKRKMAGCVNDFKSFIENVKQYTTEIFLLAPQKLNEYLEEFYIGIRKDKTKDGESAEYQPSTLDGYKSIINRYLKSNKYPLYNL